MILHRLKKTRGMDKQMITKKGIAFLRRYFVFYLAGILMILGMKFYYRQAGCDSLLWILAPTVWWVEFLSGLSFTYIPGTGYVNHSLYLLIAPSCSGVRFMIITFATLVFSFVHMAALPWKGTVFGYTPGGKDAAEGGPLSMKAKAAGFGWIAVSAALSWLFTIFVNGMRIITAIYLPMYLEDAGFMKGALTQDRLHTMIGVAVYFIALLTIYRLVGGAVQRAVRSVLPDREDCAYFRNQAGDGSDNSAGNPLRLLLRKCVPPVFWYFVLTLGLPFLNRAGRGGSTAEFAEFAVLVSGCCGLILLPCVMMLFLRSRRNPDAAGRR